jgi:DNA repair protein RadC
MSECQKSRTTISLSTEHRDSLAALGKKNQSYDEILDILLRSARRTKDKQE